MRAPPRPLGLLTVGAVGVIALAVVAVVVHMSIGALDLVGVRESRPIGTQAARDQASETDKAGEKTATARPLTRVDGTHTGSTHTGSTSATSSRGQATSSATTSGTLLEGKVQTVNCPAVKSRLSGVPDDAEAEVDRNLADLDTQIAATNVRLAQLAAQPSRDPDFVQNAILGPLGDKRISTFKRIVNAIDRVSRDRAPHLNDLAACTLND
jgi:hypothetical protein